MVGEIDVLRRDNYTCRKCGYPIILNEAPRHSKGPSIDHITWISRGGDHTIDNVQATHLRCNTQEGWQYKQARDRRIQRKSAARHRYYDQQNKKGREAALTVLGWIVGIIALMAVLSWLGSL